MIFSNQNKALLLTVLISGTLVLAMFNFHIKKQSNNIAENYFIIEPEELLTEEELKIFEQELTEKAETNKAFNENDKSRRFAQAYKTIEPPKDYEKPYLRSSKNGIDDVIDVKSSKEDSSIDENELSSFNKANDVLKKQQEKSNNVKSSVTFSLVNRTHRYLPTPIYLCEQSGKVVINILVNAQGKVVKSYYNNSSTSSNQCLIDHAIEYANNALFSSDDSKDSQIGSITFYFEGKH